MIFTNLPIYILRKVREIAVIIKQNNITDYSCFKDKIYLQSKIFDMCKEKKESLLKNIEIDI